MSIKILQPLDKRIPNWDLSKLEFRICPICNSSNSTPYLIRPDKLTVDACNVCDTFFVNPAPKSDFLDDFYKNYYKNHGDSSQNSIKHFSFEVKSRKPTTDIRIARLLEKCRFSTSNKYALDIGCGKGEFLYFLKKIGFHVQGVEPDSSVIKYASKLGIDTIFTGYLENLKSNTSYQLISLLDLVEHPLAPLDLIKKAMEHLASDGYLLIWTPNGRPNHEGLDNLTFRVDLEHMQYLTEASCRFIANALKLNLIHLETLGIHEAFYPLNDSQNFNVTFAKKNLIKSYLKKIVKNIPGWYLIFGPLLRILKTTRVHPEPINMNYHLLCIFQKPAPKQA